MGREEKPQNTGMREISVAVQGKNDPKPGNLKERKKQTPEGGCLMSKRSRGLREMQQNNWDTIRGFGIKVQ